MTTATEPPGNQTEAPSAGNGLDGLARRLGHAFRRPELLQQALVHRSYLNETPDAAQESNERLEFIGDSVLGLIVARRLYEDYPAASEGWLTEVRSRLVRNATLARIAEDYALGEALVLGRGVEQQQGRQRAAILGRTLEAVIGAVYLDDGLRAAQRVVLQALREEMAAIAIAGLERDPKSLLQEACQARWRDTPSYHTVAERGPAHEREFDVEVRLAAQVLGQGRGASKQAAEQAAARVALNRLPDLGLAETPPSPPPAPQLPAPRPPA